MTTAFTPIDSSVLTVSYNVSPFKTLDVPASNGITSNPNFLSAISKLDFVRVLGSKNRLAMNVCSPGFHCFPLEKSFASFNKSIISPIDNVVVDNKWFMISSPNIL